MCDEQVLTLLRIDVDPARDDHERGAVGKKKVAIAVEVADVANGTQRTVAGSRLGGFCRILEIFERRGALEPQLAWRAGRTGHHFVVKNMQLSVQNLAYSPFLRKPFGAIARGKAHPFGRAIILMYDWPPPFDHLLLHLNRTWRCGIGCKL